MGEELKPCPFCGSDEHIALTEIKTKGHMITCYECMVDGPFKETHDEAAKAWNTRPDPMKGKTFHEKMMAIKTTHDEAMAELNKRNKRSDD